jgi:hypothetical protein
MGHSYHTNQTYHGNQRMRYGRSSGKSWPFPSSGSGISMRFVTKGALGAAAGMYFFGKRRDTSISVTELVPFYDAQSRLSKRLSGSRRPLGNPHSWHLTIVGQANRHGFSVVRGRVLTHSVGLNPTSRSCPPPDIPTGIASRNLWPDRPATDDQEPPRGAWVGALGGLRAAQRSRARNRG